MFIDDLHFRVDQGILVQVCPDIQKKGFVVNGLAKDNGIGDFHRRNF